MSTVRYLVVGFPGALAECSRWLNRWTLGLWDGALSAVCLPGSSLHRECKALRDEVLVESLYD